ncbi:unnamed protein product [Mesocestoides corti]|uniref:EF-hand domain-containing protein n=1 Tax=Mesocestoides corti TaxID=53468 RepID=A0A0R3UFN6_MESCO|nr:unnamed protein product [Mesocestoides corti]
MFYGQSTSTKYDQHFRRFASREYNGVLYMTPDDFLHSIFLDKSPGIHLHMSFDRLDKRIQNQVQDLKYCLIYLMTIAVVRLMKVNFLWYDSNKFIVLCLSCIKFRLAFQVWGKLQVVSFVLSQKCPEDSFSKQSTLMKFFFGDDGKKMLQKQQFYRFIENVQNEILEVEFALNSPSGAVISPTEFAQVLLHNTNIPELHYDVFLSRLKRLPSNMEVVSTRLLNFIYDLAEFKRAIRACTNVDMPDHILQTLFCMFDADGDGKISPKEFMVLFQNRRARGIHKNIDHKQKLWKDFKKCVTRALREQ